MKKIVSLALSGFSVFISVSALAQSYFDEALIFSRTNPGGSARIQAMGGAQVALGGDYSSAFSNPAGLGFFNRSEATLSLGSNFYNSTSNYFGNSANDSKSNFNVPGFSLILHSDKNNGKLVGGNFAISLTRTNNFNQNFNYQGVNPNNSLIDHFIEGSNGYDPGQFYIDPPNYYINSYEYVRSTGYSNYLFGPTREVVKGGDSTSYHTYADQIPLQQEKVKTDGAQNQVNFAYGINLNDKFYLGASVGLPSFHYHWQSTYSESFGSGPLFGFDLIEDYSVKGSGINATLGGIAKPADFIQFGVSMTTPTYYYSVANNFNATLSSDWNNFYYQDVTYPKYNTTLNGVSSTLGQMVGNYTLTTPWRIKAGATVFIKKHGLITGEIESVNYSKAHYSSQTDGLDFSDGNIGNFGNSDIKNYYRSVVNIRVGGEYRISKYRLRVGYSYMPDPYITVQDGIDNAITSITSGIGYRSNKFFVDLGFSLTQWNSPYEPYYIDTYNYPNHGAAPVVKLQNTNTSIMATFGFNL